MNSFMNILKRGKTALVLLVLIAQQLIAQKSDDRNTFRFADGQIVHVVPVEVAPQALDALFRVPASEHHEGYRLLVQVGTFAIKQNAYRLKQKLELDGYTASVKEYYASKDLLYYLVYVGSYTSVDEARQKLRDIRSAYNLEGLLLAQAKAKQ